MKELTAKPENITALIEGFQANRKSPRNAQISTGQIFSKQDNTGERLSSSRKKELKGKPTVENLIRKVQLGKQVVFRQIGR